MLESFGLGVSRQPLAPFPFCDPEDISTLNEEPGAFFSPTSFQPAEVKEVSIFNVLPAPHEASDDFLIGIGLEPIAFKMWLMTIPFLVKSHNWLLALKHYVELRGSRIERSSMSELDPVKDLEAHGLTKTKAEEIAARIGTFYQEEQPECLAYHSVEETLAMSAVHLLIPTARTN